VECGRPHATSVADCMHRSRAAYHYAIRRIRKNEAETVRDRIAESMLNNKSRNFWSVIKHIRSHSASCSKTVDGISDSSSISKLFADKFRELYTCVSYNESDMQHVIQDVNDMVTEENRSGCFRFHVCDIRTAVGQLKPHKRDECIDLSSDHISNGCDELFVHITLLFNAILVHDALPDNFLRSTIVPISKGRNVDGSNSNNYRFVALSSIFRKLMVNIVLIKFSNQLQTSSLQFGFKAKSSTNL